jgi:hypothetical protein
MQAADWYPGEYLLVDRSVVRAATQHCGPYDNGGHERAPCERGGKPPGHRIPDPLSGEEKKN